MCCLLAAQIELEDLIRRFILPDLFVAGLTWERLTILSCARIDRQHLHGLAALQFRKGFFRTQDGQRAVQTARINFFIELHFSEASFRIDGEVYQRFSSAARRSRSSAFSSRIRASTADCS